MVVRWDYNLLTKLYKWSDVDKRGRLFEFLNISWLPREISWLIGLPTRSPLGFSVQLTNSCQFIWVFPLLIVMYTLWLLNYDHPIFHTSLIRPQSSSFLTWHWFSEMSVAVEELRPTKLSVMKPSVWVWKWLVYPEAWYIFSSVPQSSPSLELPYGKHGIVVEYTIAIQMTVQHRVMYTQQTVHDSRVVILCFNSAMGRPSSCMLNRPYSRPAQT